MGHWLLLLRDDRASRYLNRLIWQRDDFESNRKDGIGMAYGGYRGESLRSGIKIKNDYEGCFYAMVMIEGVIRKS
jgi:hypothetical protein